jgi:hypothetical protein
MLIKGSFDFVNVLGIALQKPFRTLGLKNIQLEHQLISQSFKKPWKI